MIITVVRWVYNQFICREHHLLSNKTNIAAILRQNYSLSLTLFNVKSSGMWQPNPFSVLPIRSKFLDLTSVNFRITIPCPKNVWTTFAHFHADPVKPSETDLSMFSTCSIHSAPRLNAFNSYKTIFKGTLVVGWCTAKIYMFIVNKSIWIHLFADQKNKQTTIATPNGKDLSTYLT